MMRLESARTCLLLATAALATACTDAGATIQVLRNQAPTAGCVVPADQGAQFLARGRIDVDAAGGYLFTPIVENRATASNTSERSIFVQGANVDITFSDPDLYSQADLDRLADAALISFRQPFSGNIEPNSTSTFAFEVLPKPLLEDIGMRLGDGDITQVVVDVEVIGSLAGDEITSSVFHYPIDVCKGCLVNNLGACANLAEGAQNLGGACQALQDGLLDCCNGAGGELVCPAVVPEEEV